MVATEQKTISREVGNRLLDELVKRGIGDEELKEILQSGRSMRKITDIINAGPIFWEAGGYCR